MNLADLIAEEEERMLAEARRQIAAEKAAYDALPQEEKDRLRAEAEAKWDAYAEDIETEGSDEADEDDEDEDDD